MERVNEIDFNRLCGIAISRLGLSVPEFYELAPVEFHYAIQETNERELNHLRNLFIVQRWSIRHLWNMRGRWVKSIFKKDRDVEMFDWEVEEEEARKKAQTPQELNMNILSVFKQIAANFAKKDKLKNKQK